MSQRSIQTIGSFFLLVALATACVTHRRKPCTEGGQPPRESSSVPFRGTKRCYQAPDKAGQVVNHGKYYEWYTTDKLALEGEYLEGKKSGRWIEYDENGKKISDKYFEDGKEVPKP